MERSPTSKGNAKNLINVSFIGGRISKLAVLESMMCWH